MAAVSVRSISIAIALLAAGAGCSSAPWASPDSPSLLSKLKRPSSSGTSDGRFAWFKGLPGRRDPALPSFGNDSWTAPPFSPLGTAEKGTLAKMGDAVNNSRLVKSVKGTLKKGTDKIADIAKPDAIGAADPISLDTPTSDPNADFYVSLARLQEHKGNVVRAEDQYRKALEIDSQNLKALLGQARLLDRLGRLKEATKLYVKATRHHPKEPMPFNDLALCYAKQGKLTESTTALTRAIELQPYRKLYRNNIATVLVEAGRADEALEHLIAAHDRSIAHYNLGFLLNQKGERQPASSHFAKAVELDPSFTEARQWLELTATRSGPGSADGRPTNPTAGKLAPKPAIGSYRRSEANALTNQQRLRTGGAAATSQQPYDTKTPRSQSQGPGLVPPLNSQHSFPATGSQRLGSIFPNRRQPNPVPGGPSHGQNAPTYETPSRPAQSISPTGPNVPRTQWSLAPQYTPADPPGPERVESTMPPLPGSDLGTTPALGARRFDPPRFPAPQAASAAPGVKAPVLPPSSTYYPPSRY